MTRLQDLPGPPGVPVFGQSFAVRPERFHQQLEDWRGTYGNRYRIRLGQPILVVADPEAIAAALRDRPDGMGRTPRLVEQSARMGFAGLFSANGDAWRRQRSMVMSALDPGHIRSYFPHLVTVTQRFADAWGRAADAGTPIELQTSLMRYTVDAIAGLALGSDINTIETEGPVIQQHLDLILPALFRAILSPIPLLPWSAKKRRLDRAVQQVTLAVQDFIAKARARLAADPALREKPRNLIEALLVARDTDGSGLDDRDVAGNVMTMLLAGEDTTANTLAWLIWLLWSNPDALAAARAEVRAVLGDATHATALDQVARLDVVEACAHEAMRLKPVAPIVVQQAHRACSVAGVELEAGAIVIFLMRGGALDARHFPDPGRFDPGRWLGGGADAGGSKRIAMPFGAGPRICPGRYLALVEIKMVMAMLLAGFDIAGVDAPAGGVRERLALTMSPVGLMLRLQRRAQHVPAPPSLLNSAAC